MYLLKDLHHHVDNFTKIRLNMLSLKVGVYTIKDLPGTIINGTYNSHSLLHLPSIGIGVPSSIGVKISRESTNDLLAKTVTIITSNKMVY
jgi:hypothetical protein